MKNLKAKLRKNGGFTLIEMLIVVAIIAILVAISIPMVGTALDKAREATDNANLRAAKAEALIMYMNDQINGVVGTTNATISTGDCYNNATGKFATGTPTGYGQSTAHKDDYIVVTITTDVTEPITVKWSKDT